MKEQVIKPQKRSRIFRRVVHKPDFGSGLPLPCTIQVTYLGVLILGFFNCEMGIPPVSVSRLWIQNGYS